MGKARQDKGSPITHLQSGNTSHTTKSSCYSQSPVPPQVRGTDLVEESHLQESSRFSQKNTKPHLNSKCHLKPTNCPSDIWHGLWVWFRIFSAKPVGPFINWQEILSLLKQHNRFEKYQQQWCLQKYFSWGFLFVCLTEKRHIYMKCHLLSYSRSKSKLREELTCSTKPKQLSLSSSEDSSCSMFFLVLYLEYFRLCSRRFDWINEDSESLWFIKKGKDRS